MNIETRPSERERARETQYELDYFRRKHRLPEDVAREILQTGVGADKADALAELFK